MMASILITVCPFTICVILHSSTLLSFCTVDGVGLVQPQGCLITPLSMNPAISSCVSSDY